MSKEVITILYILVAIVMFILAYYNYKRSEKKTNKLVILILLAGLTILMYALALNSKHYFWLSLYNSLLFVSIDWLLYFLFKIVVYTYGGSISFKKSNLLILILVIIDNIALLINPFKEFSVSYRLIKVGKDTFFEYIPHIAYKCHLMLCYVIFGLVFIALIIKASKSSEVSRKKYYTYLVGLVGIVVFNGFYLISDLYIDISLLSYGFIGLALTKYYYEYDSKRLVKMTKSLAVDNSKIGSIIFDENKRFVYANNTANSLFSDINDNYDDFISSNHLEKLHDEANQELIINGGNYHVELELINDRNDYFIGYCLSINDISDLQKLLNERVQLLSKDNLTKLDNRILFIEKANRILNNNVNNTYTLVIVNVEHFKVINNIFGYNKGDAVLKNIAKNLRNYFGKSALITRLQSDHFAIMIDSRFINVEELNDYLDKNGLLDELNKARYIYGVFEDKEHINNIEMMIESANIAIENNNGMYSNYINYYNDNDRLNLLREQQLTRAMPDALKNGEFVIYVQPQYLLPENQIIGGEVLVRWIDKKKGLISPDKFIHIFEKNGLITKLDLFVWEQTCKLIKDLNNRGYDKQRTALSVNISQVDFTSIDLVETFTNLIKKYELEPWQLKLEVTESTYTKDKNLYLQTIKALEENNFTVEMDDFGSGYSSLNSLRDIPVDVLKLDMRFLDNRKVYGRGGTIVQSVIRMARWLNISTIVEGVENKTQSDYLVSIGATVHQGFKYCKPVSVDKYIELLDDMQPIEEVTYHRDELKMNYEDIEKSFNLIFHNSLNPTVIAEYSFNVIETLQANDAFYSEFNSSRNYFLSSSPNALDFMSDEDIKIITDTLNKCIHDAQFHNCIVHPVIHNGVHDVKITARMLYKMESSNIFILTFNSIEKDASE